MGEVSNAMICLLGMGIVFLGLIVMVYLCKLMSSILQKFEKNTTPQATVSALPIAVPAPQEVSGSLQPDMEIAVSAVLAEMLNTDISSIHISSCKEYEKNEIPNRQEMIAAISATVAEMENTDISGIRILSLKQI